MSHIEDARNSTQMVVKLLVNRFGGQEEVFRHLTDVLRHIGEAEAEFARMTVQPEAVAVVEVGAATEAAPQVHPEQPVSTESELEVETTAAATETPTEANVGYVYEPQEASEPEAPETAPEPERRARRKRGKQ